LRFFFTKADRILKQSEFLQLAKFGKKAQNQYFVAIFSPGRFKRSRLGITVAKKVGNATIRNRIKRFTRENYRLNRHIITGYWDINIIAKKKAAALSSKQTFLSLQNIYDRISRSRGH
jgi:ribonuclease P protein component